MITPQMQAWNAIENIQRHLDDAREHENIETWTVDYFLRRIYPGWTVTTLLTDNSTTTAVLHQDNLVTTFDFVDPTVGDEAGDDEDMYDTRAVRFDQAIGSGVTGTSHVEMIDGLSRDAELARTFGVSSTITTRLIEALIADAPADQQDALRMMNALREA